MPEAFMATTTSPGPGVGSGNSRSSSFRSPKKTTPRISASSRDGVPREVLGLLRDELEERGHALLRLHHGPLDGRHDLGWIRHTLAMTAERARHRGVVAADVGRAILLRR